MNHAGHTIYQQFLKVGRLTRFCFVATAGMLISLRWSCFVVTLLRWWREDQYGGQCGGQISLDFHYITSVDALDERKTIVENDFFFTFRVSNVFT